MGHNKAKARAQRLTQAAMLGAYKQWQKEREFMARGNTPRWNWLMETFKTLPGFIQANIRTEFAERYDNSKLGDDQVMHEIMTEFGIVIKGTDPRPPPKVYATDAGAQEYDEIILIQDLGEDL